METKRLTGYELSDLPSLGYLTITWLGEENLYFTLADGSEGFVKLGHSGAGWA